MSTDSRKDFFGSHITRLVLINFITVLVMAIALFLVVRTFDQISSLFERDVNRNLKIALNSFELDKELVQMMVVTHEKEDTLLHDPEGMLAARQEVVARFDDIFRRIKLTENYFNHQQAYHALQEYRHAVEQKMTDNVMISKSVLQLDLLNQSFLTVLNEMEVAAGKIIVERVLAGFDVTGLNQVNALLPFCRELILEAGSLMDRAVIDLEPDRISPDTAVDEKKTLEEIINSLTRTLETLTSAHPSIAVKAGFILKEIDSYLNVAHSLKAIMETKLLHGGELEAKQKELIQRQSRANKEMAASLLQIGENTRGEMGKAMRGLYLLAFVILIVSVGSAWIAQIVGRKMGKNAAEKERTRLELETKMDQLVSEISKRQVAEDEVRSLNRKLEQSVQERTFELNLANKELESLVYSMSHDLRTPLRGIAGFSNVLLADYAPVLDEFAKAYLHRIGEGSIKMGRTIDAILELSRLTREEIHPELVNLSKVAEGIVEELRRNHPERDVKVEISPGLSAYVSSPQIKAVLESLLDNAWKFTSKKESAKIEFGREEKEGEAVYFIRDNGAGFSMAHSGKMFGAFQRLHSLEEFPGVGIGLAIVQRGIHKQGGKIWAESREGEGATFYFTLS